MQYFQNTCNCTKKVFKILKYKILNGEYFKYQILNTKSISNTYFKYKYFKYCPALVDSDKRNKQLLPG